MLFEKIKHRVDWIFMMSLIVLPSVFVYQDYLGLGSLLNRIARGGGEGWIFIGVFVIAVFIFAYGCFIGFFVSMLRKKFFVYAVSFFLLACLQMWLTGEGVLDDITSETHAPLFLSGIFGIFVGSGLKKLADRFFRNINASEFFSGQQKSISIIFISLAIFAVAMFISIVSLSVFDRSSPGRFLESCSRTKYDNCYERALYSYPIDLTEGRFLKDIYNVDFSVRGWSRNSSGNIRGVRIHTLFERGRIEEAVAMCELDFRSICNPLECIKGKHVPDRIIQKCKEDSDRSFLQLEKTVKRGY